jgi:DNA topoisomerase IB
VSDRIKEFNPHYKPKDLRTLVANEVAGELAQSLLSTFTEPPASSKEKKKRAKEVVKQLADAVSSRLGNTPSVAIKEYVDPHLVNHVIEKMGLV